MGVALADFDGSTFIHELEVPTPDMRSRCISVSIVPRMPRAHADAGPNTGLDLEFRYELQHRLLP